MDYVVILTTAGNKKEAKRIALKLVNKRLAACVNIVPAIESTFRWKGNVDSAKEALLLVKTRDSLIDKVITTIRSLHSYEVPEIIALPIIRGNPDYLNWLRKVT